MTRLPTIAAAIVAASLLSIVDSEADADSCYVNDPTGTPLNVRTSPNNGHVVGTLSNGTPVSLLDRASDGNGRSWVYVGNSDRKPIGWVYRNFLDCSPQANEVKMPPELVGGWCYETIQQTQSYRHCALDEVDGGESIIIHPDGYTSPEMQANWGASPDALTCRVANVARDQRGVYTIDFNKCFNNGTERWAALADYSWSNHD